MNTIYLRADGNSSLGVGHIYRMIALAKILRDRFSCVLTIKDPPGWIKTMIHDERLSLLELEKENQSDLTEFVRRGDCIVIDGYHFDLKFQQALREHGCLVVCIDDFVDRQYAADVIINHAPGIDNHKFRITPGTKIYTGLDYAILRPEFFSALDFSNKAENSAFVSLGGADPFNYTTMVVEMLLKANLCSQIHILGSNSFSDLLKKKIQSITDKNPEVICYYNLSASQIVGLHGICEYAVVSASTVLMEAYSRGLKCIAGWYVDNQEIFYNGYVGNNFAAGLHHFKDLSRGRLETCFAETGRLNIRHTQLNSKKNIVELFEELFA